MIDNRARGVDNQAILKYLLKYDPSKPKTSLLHIVVPGLGRSHDSLNYGVFSINYIAEINLHNSYVDYKICSSLA